VTSSRLSWQSGQNAISLALEGRRARGLPVIDLTESNPTAIDLPLPEGHGAAILQALSQPGALRYDPQPKGLQAAREAVARYLATKKATVDPEQILMTASTSEAYALLFKLLCDPGDQVLVPEPSYPLFGYLTALESVQAVPYPLRYDGEWHLSAESISTALEAAPRVRAILVVNPGNPTGAYLKRDERARLARLCKTRGLALISDEVFADFAAPLDPSARDAPAAGAVADHPSSRVETVAAFDDVLSFALSGLSKVAGLPQLKLGWCAVTGPAREVAHALAALELIADTYLSVGAPVQHAAGFLLEARHPFQRALSSRLAVNRASLLAARQAGASWDVLPAEGGWSAILSVPRSIPEEEWTLRLLDRGVLVHPGYFFDFPTGAHLVLSLLPPEARFAQAARTIAEVLRAEAGSRWPDA